MNTANNQYQVNFGNLLVPEGFGFIQNGTVTVENNDIIFRGKKSWNFILKMILIFLISIAISIGLLWAFKIQSNGAFNSFIILNVFTLVNYFAVFSHQILSIPKDSITEVKRNGKQIKFKARHPETGQFKKTFFTVDTKENALMLEDILIKRVNR